jgi:choline dehydrogenase-like flavoprotein
MLDKVDVLIIGSGAAVAWSLADTKMHIVCLEQGDWSLLDSVRTRPRMYRRME